MAQRQQPEFEIEKDAFEVYVDSVHVNTQLYGSTLLLGQLRQDGIPLVRVIAKMSPPMVKVVSLILSKHVREYEEGVGPIPIPTELLHNGLEDLI